MFAKLVINGIEIQIGYEKLADMLLGIEDNAKYLPIFRELVHSPDPKVRAYVAARECIEKDLVDILLRDKQIDVLRALINNTNAIEFIEEQALLKLIALEDSELLETIGRYLEYFELCNLMVIGQKLILSDNPRVRGALADNPDVPEDLLFALLEDTDSDIAASAHLSLSIKREEEFDDSDEWDELPEVVESLRPLPLPPEQLLQNLNYAKLTLLFQDARQVTVIKVELNEIPNAYSSAEWEALVKMLSQRWIQQQQFRQPATVWLRSQIAHDTDEQTLTNAAFIVQFGLPVDFLQDLAQELEHQLQGGVSLVEQFVTQLQMDWLPRCHVEHGKVWEPLDDITWVAVDNPEIQAVCVGGQHFSKS